MALGYCAFVTVLCAACSSTPSETSNGSIEVGVLLPFTGNNAAIGWNIEQAILLAEQDVNNAGGIAGKRLSIIERDSNSGTERGLDQLLQLLYFDQVKYLIGPEEDTLANDIVQDIEGLGVFNILPGFGAPSIKRAGIGGAWLCLAPTPYATGCAMAKHATEEGVSTANTLSSTDDYSMNLASSFGGLYGSGGGTTLPTVTISAAAGSYESEISRAFSYGAQRTLLIVPTSTAVNIITEWTVSGHKGAWYLSPLLRDDALLYNIPYGSLNGSFGMSPTQSLESECEMTDSVEGYVHCKRDNAQHFNRHFADNWGGAVPFSAANFYYDAVVLLAITLNYASAIHDGPVSAPRLQQIIRENNVPASASANWWELPTALALSRQGTPLRYVGAAAEYKFDRFGAAQFLIFDTWTVRNNAFVEAQPYYADCSE